MKTRYFEVEQHCDYHQRMWLLFDNFLLANNKFAEFLADTGDKEKALRMRNAWIKASKLDLSKPRFMFQLKTFGPNIAKGNFSVDLKLAVNRKLYLALTFTENDFQEHVLTSEWLHEVSQDQYNLAVEEDL